MDTATALKWWAVMIAMGVFQPKTYRNPWSTNPLLGNDFCKKNYVGYMLSEKVTVFTYHTYTFSYRFYQAVRATRVCSNAEALKPGGIGDKSSPNYKRMWKVWEYCQITVKKMAYYYNPTLYLAVDEMM